MKEQLYQATVVQQDGRRIAIGPAVNVKSVLYKMVESINASYAKGMQKDWRDAEVSTVEQDE